jgi:hypothetical protein
MPPDSQPQPLGDAIGEALDRIVERWLARLLVDGSAASSGAAAPEAGLDSASGSAREPGVNTKSEGGDPAQRVAAREPVAPLCSIGETA